MTDQQIIHLLKNGQHHQALLKLYRYQRVVQKHITHNNGSKEEANDIFQEGLIILCRKVKDEQFQLTSSLDTYLFGICKFLWRDELKKKSKTSAWTTIEVAEDAAMEETIEQESNYKLAEAALQKVSDICQKILRLFYLEKKSMTDIAGQLGYSSENATKTQKYKCLEKAREYYQLTSIHQ